MLCFCDEYFLFPCLGHPMLHCVMLSSSIVLHSHMSCTYVNTFRPGKCGHHFADNFFKNIFLNILNENNHILIIITLKYFPWVQLTISHISPGNGLVQSMAPCLSTPSHHLNQWWPSSLMHICVTRPQWVKWHLPCHHKPTIALYFSFTRTRIFSWRTRCWYVPPL